MSMTDQDLPQTEPSGKPNRVYVVLALALALVVVVAGVVIVRNRAARPERAALAHTNSPAPAAAKPIETPAPPEVVVKPKTDGNKPLPELVPGSPLDDDQFAQVSAQIVIGAMGLKRDADWETNVLLYMQQTLKKSGVSVEQYSEYASALHGQPDRARAVAENIMMRVEKKVGYRVSMDKLPMFKFDDKTIKQLEKKLTD
jgi:hypothetical protein